MRSAQGHAARMKATSLVALVLLGFGVLAAVQEGPLQVWLLILAPFALIAVALLLRSGDGAKSHEHNQLDVRINHPWGM